MTEFLVAILPYHEIDPVAFSLGPLLIRWYSLSYIAGLVLGWLYARWLAGLPPQRMTKAQIDDFLVWATLGVVLGGRLGYVLFYNFGTYLTDPLAVLKVWEGGMSFHGGLVGVLLATLLFTRKHGLPFLALADILACVTPIGLFFGRLANFVNGELFGRPSDVAWAMVFPAGGPEARHPSQLYEAGLEGLRRGALRALGRLGGLFLLGYGLSRFIVEFFREPDAHIGFLFGITTMGQLLSIPMILFGIYLMVRPSQEKAEDRAQIGHAKKHPGKKSRRQC
jgi:phosphatidylglycerol:prolipoprotein diacylglycerol transferase